MFNNKENDVNRIETLIGEHCYIIGSLNVNGLIKIDGSIDGDLFCEDDIILGTSGHLKGNVVCNNAYIHGILHGNICCKSTLTIENCGNVKGDISVKKLMVSDGGLLDGKCTMLGYDDPDSDSETETATP